jgi:hypothetical protein
LYYPSLNQNATKSNSKQNLILFITHNYSVAPHGSPDGNKKPLPTQAVILPMLAGDLRSPDKTEQKPDLGQALV